MLTTHIHEFGCDTQVIPQASLFQTQYGWWGMLGCQAGVLGLTIGQPTAEAALKRLTQSVLQDDRFHDGPEFRLEEADWNPDLRRRLEDYAVGVRVDFSDCEVVLPNQTAFQKRVVKATRQIGYGETVTYGQLAKKSGSPNAARAVGSVMSSNRVPIIIPCHRVVGVGNSLGGFSAPQGVGLKERLLAMESGE